jgi:hypothetical protein
VKRLRSCRPSPALVISILALLVATAGTGYAALKLPRNSVGSKQIKKNAVNSSKVADRSLRARDFRAGALPTGPQGPKGDQGSPGEQGLQGAKGDPGPAIRWALFNADGAIAVQSGGISLTSKPGTGDYVLDMGTQVPGHALLVSVSNKAGGAGGNILVAPCGSGPDSRTCAGLDAATNADGRHVQVSTSEGMGNPALPFYIVMFQ